MAINTLDFKSDIPFVFDRMCAEQGIYVLRPFNVGFAGVVMVISPDRTSLESLRSEGESYLGFERRAIQHVTDYFNYWVRPKIWVEEEIRK